MYESPPPLKFPSLAILRKLTRSILDELLSEENEILQNKRSNLVFKQFSSGNCGAPLQTGKRKPKVTNACQNCKKSKTGCDGYLPCDNCKKRSKLCEYPPGVTPLPRPASSTVTTSDAGSVDPTTTKIATIKTTTHPLPTPTEPTELKPVSHDDPFAPPPPPQPAFVIGRFSAQQRQPPPTPPPPPPPPTQQHYFPVPETITLVTENNVDSPANPPSSSKPQACTDRYGHFTGDTTFFIPQQSAPLPAGPSSTFPQRPATPQFLSADIQASLIDTFYAHANPFFPAIMNKTHMLAELNLLRTDQPSQLSQLFFHAVFSRAASLTSGEDFVQQDTPERKTWSSISDALIASAFEARDDYLESPHISTLLALVIIANHFEHNKFAKNLRRAWMLIGDAGRLAIDMGLHRASRLLLHPDGEDDVATQMCIRTFWAVCVSERTMSITYGRPSMFDDKDIDVPSPKCLPMDDEHTKNWVESLRQLVTMSNIACRIMRFNYSAQTQFSGAFRVNAAVSTIDCWMCSESDEDLEDRLLHGIEATDPRKRLNDLEALYFYSNLIQLHKPFMRQDASTKGNDSTRPSFVICHLAAIAISHIAHTTPITELADICKSPPTLYAIIKALQVHLDNASHPESDRTVAFSEISFERTISQLRKLPVIARHEDDSSMLTETLNFLEQKYYQRTNTIVAGYLISRRADSPVPTLCSNGTSATSVSSVEGAIPSVMSNNQYQNSIPSSSSSPSLPITNKQQRQLQGNDWGGASITFVNVDPAMKNSTLGKRRSRETNSKKAITTSPSPSSLSLLKTSNREFRSSKQQRQHQRQRTEPASLPSPSITSIQTPASNIDAYYHQYHQQQHPMPPQPHPETPFYIHDFISTSNNTIVYSNSQQQQLLTQDAVAMPTTVASNTPNVDTHPPLYSESHIIPPRLEQDPDLPSAILNEESWSTTSGYY